MAIKLDDDLDFMVKFQGSMKRLTEAYDLLEQVWTEIGPYQMDKIKSKTLYRLQKFFGFDDAE